jgi:zinc protease
MRTILALLLAFAAGGVLAAERGGELDIPYQKHVLPNGLTLILHEDHKAPVVAVNIWYHVGSKDERPGRTGFAHLFEHLMFNGSENYNDDYFKAMSPAGATTLNGTTWLDRTNYYQNVPTSALDMTLWLESDRMGHLLGAIDQAKLDEQRGVVQNEKRQRENQPYGKVYDLVATNTYPAGHPYSWSTIGSMEDLNAASLDDVKEWFRTWYGAANAVLVVAGDIDPAEVKRKVEYYFGDIPGGPALKRAQSWVAKMSGEKRAVIQDHVPQARIYKVWNIPGTTTRDSSLLDVAGYALAGSKNSRLYKRLVYDEQIATDVSAGPSSFEIGGQFWIYATVKPGGDPRVVEKALDEELTRFLRTGPTADELERFRASNYAGMARMVERIGGDGKSAMLAESQVYGGSPDFYKQQFDWAQQASAADVQKAAQQWLSDGVFVLEVQPIPEYVTAKSGADRSKLPALGTPPALNLPELQRTTLSNGLKVALAERPGSPVVQLQLLVDAGTASDSLAKPGTATLASIMLTQGTKTRDALQIAARAEMLGARVGASSSLDTTSVALNALASKLPESLELFSDVLLNPTFPEDELGRQRAQLIAGIRQQKTQPQGIVARLMPGLIYGPEHPYSTPASGDEGTVGAMTSTDLREFYRRWIRPDNATLLIVGGTTLGEIKPLLEQRLGAWKKPQDLLPVKKLPSVARQTKPRVFLVNRTGALQSLITAAYPAPTRLDPEFISYQTVNTILGGSFLSRLNMNLREDKHWSYGASSGLRGDARGPGVFQLNAPVQTDKTIESVQEVLKELRELPGSRPATAEETKVAKDSIVLSLPGSIETAEAVSGFYRSILTNELPGTYWNDFVGKVNALGPAEVQAAAVKLVQPQALTWLIVGDLTKIEDGIRKLDLGEVKVLDADGKVVR